MSRSLLFLALLSTGCRDQGQVKDLGGKSIDMPVPSTGTAATVPAGARDIPTGSKRVKPNPSHLSIRTGAYGAFLVDANGRALYAFSGDDNGQAACLTNCATVWPPVIVERVPRLESTSIDATKLEIITRPDGSRQLAYAKLPLYYSDSDFRAEDTWGHYAMSFGGRFTLVSPDGKPLPPPR
jgi:predicted lipoprotein with Yx(FWY)xxD motif